MFLLILLSKAKKVNSNKSMGKSVRIPHGFVVRGIMKPLIKERKFNFLNIACYLLCNGEKMEN